MGKEIRSHIQMPKLLLKRFHNEQNFFYYYDIEKKHIGNHGSANSINTKLGYYSIQTEHYLRDNIETPFGKILAIIEKIDFNQDQFTIDSDFRLIVLDFMFSLIARNPSVQNHLNQNSVFAQFLPDQLKHDFSAMSGADIGQKNNMFSEYVLTFIVNMTEVPFVLSVGGLYSYSLNGHTCVNLPISPDKALCLVHKDYAERLIHNGTISMFLVKESDKIQTFNEAAFITQTKEKWGYVICPEETELKRLAENLGNI